MTRIINVGENAGNSYIFRSGIRMRVTPEGDCREATFIARGRGIDLNPLDAVQINVNGIPTFYGEVRVGGNPYDLDGHQFTIRSMALRLKEVVLPEGWSAPKQPAHLTIQSMINAVLPQLGSAITGVSVTDLGFDARPVVNANEKNPHALLEQIASDGEGFGVKVRFGVDASGQFFCRPAKTDSTALTHDMLTGATHWVAPVAEAPCTAVQWFVSKKPDGTWLTHLSQAPEAQVYGVRVKPLSLKSDKGLWQTVPGTYTAGSSSDSGVWEIIETTSEAAATLQDRQLGGDSAGVVGGGVRLTFTPSVTPDRYVIAASVSRGSLLAGFYYADTQTTVPSQPVWSTGVALNMTYYPEEHSGNVFGITSTTRFLDANGKSEPLTLNVYELRGEILDTALLDRLAKFHYSIPATAPADIEIRGFSQARTGYVTYNGWQSPVDAWEIRVSADRGVNVGVLAGQADDPAKLAQAELIKARDGRAVIAALTSKE